MWKNSNFTLPTVLIVESDNGDVFIVENKESKPEIEKIIQKKTEKSPNTSRRKTETKVQQRPLSPIPVK